MPDGSVSSFALVSGSEQPAPFLVTLGRRLAAAKMRADLLDQVSRNEGFAAIQAKGESRSLRAQQIQAAERAAEAEADALEDLILATPARTVAEAAVQLMVARRWLSLIGGSEPDESTPGRLEVVERAVYAAMKVCAAATDLLLGDVGGAHYACAYGDPFPAIDLSGVALDDDPELWVICDAVPAVAAR